MTNSLIRIQTCGGHTCKGKGIVSIFKLFAQTLNVDLEKGGISADGKFELIKGVACQGKCENGPIVTAWKGGEKYVFSQVNKTVVKKIIDAFA